MNIKIPALACVGLLFTGCVSYNGMSVDADDLVDEGNQTYAAQAQKAYVARMKAPPRPVVVVEAPEMSIFLGPTSFGGHPLCNDRSIRKELAVAFKGQLREKISSIKDFKLMDEAEAMVAVGDEIPPATNYRLTYNITSLELKENAAGSLTTGLIGQGLVGGRAGQKVANQKFWDGVAKVEVRLFKPDGTTPIFSFVGEGVYNKMIDVRSPLNKTILLEAVKIAASNAMDGYAQKFGPPTFVTDTCQGGQFAKINCGAKFGVKPGTAVEFYRNKVRQSATGEDEVARKVVGHGVIGTHGAPVEDDGAWVYVEDFDPAARTVFRWTSARILPVK